MDGGFMATWLVTGELYPTGPAARPARSDSPSEHACG
jgi:hypothetical protein